MAQGTASTAFNNSVDCSWAFFLLFVCQAACPSLPYKGLTENCDMLQVCELQAALSAGQTQ